MLAYNYRYVNQEKTLRRNRKLIAELMKIGVPVEPEALRPILLDDDNEEAADARMVLAGALTTIRKSGVSDPVAFYGEVCESEPEQLAESLSGVLAGRLALDRIARAQEVLKEQLAAKTGRPATGSPEQRRKQLSDAQARRREKLGRESGRKQINEWISMDAAERLAKIQSLHNCKSRAEALELVLQESILSPLLAPSQKPQTQ